MTLDRMPPRRQQTAKVKRARHAHCTWCGGRRAVWSFRIPPSGDLATALDNRKLALLCRQCFNAARGDQWVCLREGAKSYAKDFGCPRGGYRHHSVRRDKAPFLSGCESRPATVAPAGSNRSGRWRQRYRPKHSDDKGRPGRLSDHAGRNDVNAEQASKLAMRKPTRPNHGEGCQRSGSERHEHRPVPPG